MNILEETINILKRDGYNIQEILKKSFVFEDRTIVGYVEYFDSSKNLLMDWEKRQDEFLKKYAPNMLANPEKAWNIYTIFLTDDKCDIRNIINIEEDFRSTRKIVGVDISSKKELERILYPLIKIKNLMELKTEYILSDIITKMNYPEFLELTDLEDIRNNILGKR